MMPSPMVRILFACCIFVIFQVKFQYAAEVEIDAEMNKSMKDSKFQNDLSNALQNEKEKPEVGLCLSGGAFASTIVGGGILRGFQKSKIIDDDGKEVPALSRFDYMSGVSGGLLTILMYAYAQDTTSDEILDADGISDPSLLTEEILNNIPEKSLFAPFSNDLVPYFVQAIVQKAAFKKTPWLALVEALIFERFKICPYHPVDLTRDDVHAELIATASIVGPMDVYPEWRIDINKKFVKLFQETDRFLDFDPPIENVKLLPTNDEIWEIIKESNFQIPLPAFMTSKKEFTIPTAAHKVLLNHKVKNLDFEPVSLSLDEVQPEGEGPFTALKMFGIGANLIPLIAFNFPDLATELLDDPILVDVPDKNGEKRELVAVDSGMNDWEGMLSLLKKNVTTIISSAYRTGDNVDWTTLPWLEATRLATWELFGVADPRAYALNTTYVEENFPVYPNLLQLTYTRHVFNLFSNGENQVLKLQNMYKSLYEAHGEPLIATLENLEVIENKVWGIEGGMRVDVTFISTIGVPKKFSEQIPEDLIPPKEGESFTYENGYFSNDETFVKFPGFTFNRKQKLSILDWTIELDDLPDYSVDTKYARLLEILTSWMVERAWNGLKGQDGKVKFKGFKSILS